MYYGPPITQPIAKQEKPLRSKAPLQFLHELPCICTGAMQPIVAHHLLRCPSRRGQYKAGDQHTVPLLHSVHVSLHDDWGDELAFFASYGITDPVEIANGLWANTGNHAVCIELINEERA